MLSRQAILEANDLKTETVSVPEWGGEVFVRTMTGTERDRYECEAAAALKANRKINLRATVVARVVVDANGQRIFQDEDIPILGSKSASALERVYSVAARLARITEEDVKELEKN